MPAVAVDEVVLGRHVDDSLKACLDLIMAFDLATWHSTSLSGGQKQRVILASIYRMPSSSCLYLFHERLFRWARDARGCMLVPNLHLGEGLWS